MDNKIIKSTLLLAPILFVNELNAQKQQKPNVIFILADDLGLGDLGCYGQRQIKTPEIDRMAREGMIFTTHYSGSTVSAPSRGSLMTGKHIGHAYIRGNKGYKGEDGSQYDEPLKDEEITLGEIFKSAGYKTACIGKWGLGGPNSEGHPLNQGFDRFYGYLSQLNAHNYYPQFLWDNNKKVMLNGEKYTHDLVIAQAVDYIKNSNGDPFFLYLTPTIPHADLKLPKEHIGEYENSFLETPFAGGGYTECSNPRATFAAMVTHLDSDVGRIISLLKELNIDDNTIIVFTSDNGTHSEGGHDPYYFESSGGFRGQKRDLYEGGIRTPFIVRWSSVIKEGSVSTHVSSFWDFMPTMCDLIGVSTPKNSDGISYLPTLTSKGKQQKHDNLYFEFHEMGGKQAVIKDNWKLIRLNAQTPEKVYYELYDLSSDPTERHNLYAQEKTRVKEMETIMNKQHINNDIWNFPAY